MRLQSSETLLCLVDYQAKLMPAIHESERVVQNAKRLAKAAQLLKIPIIGTEQNPGKLGKSMEDLGSFYDKVLSKMHFSACEDGLVELISTFQEAPQTSHVNAGNARSLPQHLRKPAPKQVARNSIVLAGCEAHICLLQTALDLMDEELDVWIVTDACGSRTIANRDAAFDRLAGAGAELVTTEMVLYEWVASCEHRHFKAILEIVKEA